MAHIFTNPRISWGGMTQRFTAHIRQHSKEILYFPYLLQIFFIFIFFFLKINKFCKGIIKDIAFFPKIYGISLNSMDNYED